MAGLSFDDLDGTAPLSEDEALGAINLATGSATGNTVAPVAVTSQYRTPEHNAAIGGAANSMHTRGTGQAMDFQLPPGADPAAVRAELQRQGYPVSEWLIEHAGDPHSTGSHIHWGWGQKGPTSVSDQKLSGGGGPVDFSDLDGGATNTSAPSKGVSGPVSFDDLDPDPSWGAVLGAQFRTTFDRWKQMAAGALQGLAETPAEFMPRNPNISEFHPDPYEGFTPAQKAQDLKDRQAVAQWSAKVYADAQQHIKETVPDVAPGSAKDYAGKITAGVIDLVPVVAAGVVTEGVTLPAILMGGTAAAQTYGAARAAGRTPQQASMDATFTGMVNGALGTLPIGVLMKPGQPFLGKVLQSAGSFGAFSVVTEAMQIGYDKGLVTPDMTLAQAWQRLKDAGITGTLTGALLGAGHGGLEAAVGRYHAAAPQKPVQQRVEPTVSQPPETAAAPVAPRPAARRADLLAKAAIPEPGTVQPATEEAKPPPAEPFFKPEDIEEPGFKTGPAQIAQEHEAEVSRVKAEAATAAEEKHRPEIFKEADASAWDRSRAANYLESLGEQFDPSQPLADLRRRAQTELDARAISEAAGPKEESVNQIPENAPSGKPERFPIEAAPPKQEPEPLLQDAPEPEPKAPPPPAPSLPDAVQPQASQPVRHTKLADAVADRLQVGGLPMTARQLQAEAEGVYGGTLASGAVSRDEMYDAAELGLNRLLRTHPDAFSPGAGVSEDMAVQRAEVIAELKNKLPTQTVRAGEKETHQQFSTPPDYAYAATWAADLHPSDVVLEPSAGTGSFVAHALNAGVREVHANDLSDRRADMLRALDPTNVTQEDAEHLNSILPETVKPTVVLMNPPFSQTAGRMGKKMVLGTDAKHVQEALDRLQPGGRLIAILGGGTVKNRPFWNRIAKSYDLRASVGVEGAIYRKYGTTFPTRLVVIDKNAPSGRPVVEVEGLKSATEIIRALEQVRGERLHAAGEPATPERPSQAVAGPGEGIVEPGAAVPHPTGLLGAGEGGGAAEPGGPAGRPAGPGERPARGQGKRGKGARGGVPLAAVEPERPITEGAGGHPAGPVAAGQEPVGSGGGGAGDGIVPDGSGQRADPGVTEAPAVVRATEISLASPTSEAPLSDAVYEPYAPQRLQIEGATRHPGLLVQSAAMASVLPPRPAHDLAIPRKLIERGALSDAQLEAVVYAGAAHDAPFLPETSNLPARRRGFFIGDGTGPQPLTAKLLTPNGWKAMGDARVGDLVIATDGTPAMVTGVYPQGEKEVFRVTFTDGATTEACGEHLWSTTDKDQRNYKKMGRGGSRYWSAKILNTAQIAARLRRAHDVPVPSPAQFKASPLPLDPYLVGALLGDGCIRAGGGTQIVAAPEMIAFIAVRLPEGVCARKVVTREYHYNLVKVGGRAAPRRASPLSDGLRFLGIIGLRAWEKHVPEQIRFNTPEARLACLQGLMDTDGYVDRRSICTFTSVSRDLAEDVIFLVRSLGGVARIGEKPTKRRLAYNVTVNMPVCPFLVIRSKVARWRPHAKYPPRRYFRSIESVGPKETQCIEIDHPSHLYVTDDFIVTHNTGKGREVAGIIQDNWQRGVKKHIWVSEKKPLINDAKRDMQGVGLDPKTVIDHGAVKPSEAIKHSEGVLFTTYDTLKSAEKVKGTDEQGKPVNRPGKTRLQQIVDWVGPDFDGVIAFDEAHNLGNSMDTKANRGVKKASGKALAGVELQNRLPNARVVYVSATGATEVSNLAYADRLGLWGKGTAFADRDDFLSKVSSGGVAAMELVARDMKALGRYIARNLSYEGVEYDRLEHPLTPDQTAVYDQLAEAWQLVLRNFNAAMEKAGITEPKEEGGGSKTKNAQAKSAILSQFWGGHQRFFNQVITSMQMPTVLKAVERDIAAGRAAVLQLVNTNEAAQERALSKIAAEGEPEALEDLDMSPRDQLMQLVSNAFPVNKFEEYADENGNIRSRPAMDSKGNPVQDPALVAAREALLDQLGSIKVPDGPLEMLLNRFGTDKVSEVTGRKQRVVREPDPKTGQMRTVVQKRPGSSNVAEANLFQEGKKPILVFSEAGGTGRSYHADINAASADKRRSHYLVQAGWRADKAVQGFGRTHRTNQASAPIFHLVTTDLQGQKRFISSIARRLGQLGALTKGERRTGNQGMFGLRDNLESDEARDALKGLYRDVAANKVPGVGMEELQDQMGLKLLEPETGRLVEQLPPMTQFLNRLLSLKTDLQNRVFEEFSRRMDDVIDRAAAAGTLDTGVETYQADRIRKVADQVVYTDPETGAETRHVHLVSETKNRPATYNDVVAKLRRNNASKDAPFVRSKRSGKVFGVADATDYTDKEGRIVEQKKLLGPLDFQFLDSYKLNNEQYWEPVDDAKAEGLWTDQVRKLPEFNQEDLHLVTGAVLPIWDRLKGSPKIFRLQTDAGERMLGRVIPNDTVNETLQALGAEKLKISATPAEMATAILQRGKRAELANGWIIKRSLVAGEPRLELIGPDYNFADQLKRDGVFSERIDWKTRFFIPTGDDAAKVIAAVTDGRPVTSLASVAAEKESSQFQRAYHGSPYDFDRFENRALGTGEGAHAYGHGHYFSGARAVADYYRQSVSGKRTDVATAIERAGVDAPKGSELAGAIYSHAARGDNPENAAKHIRWRVFGGRPAPEDAKLAAAVREVQRDLKGRLYTVTLAPKEHEWLDFDKPFERQSPQVQEGLKRLGTNVGELARRGELKGKNGREIYRYLTADHAPLEEKSRTVAYTGFDGQPRASEALREAGIPGIRYADQDSRLAVAQAEAKLVAMEERPPSAERDREIAALKERMKENTHNYVVFDPDHIAIDTKEQRARFAGNPEQPPGPVVLAPDLVAQLPHEASPEELRAVARVSEIASRMVPKAEVVATRKLYAADADQQRLGEITGASTRGPRRLIAWSLASPDQIGTLRHEAIHWLKSGGFFRAPEWSALVKAAQTGDWIGRYNIHERYPDLGFDGKIEEAIAEQFAYWRRGLRGVPQAIRPVFEKIATLLGRVRDYLRQAFGHDTTVANVFNRIESGEVGSRPVVGGGAVGEAASRFQNMDPEERNGRLAEGARRLIDVSQDLQMAVAPMARGGEVSRATVKDFANLMRAGRDFGQFQMDRLKREFTPAQLKEMWEAADEQSIAAQEGRSPREGGLSRLNDKERAAVNEVQRDAQSVWNAMREAGQIEGEGIPHYVPHLYVEVGETGYRRLGSNRAVKSIPGMGRNVTTRSPHLLHRKYLTAEEGAEAAAKKFGVTTAVLKDIRTLPLATMRNRSALAGFQLLKTIKEMGGRVGEDWVAEGDTPPGFFHIDHPAFFRYRPAFVTEEATGKVIPAKDQNGNMVWQKVPLSVREDWEGPLRAALTEPEGDVYRAFMSLKMRAMNNIMFSPLVQLHLLTELGRSFPAAPWKVATLKILFEGNRAKNDPATRLRAVMAGMVPIGHRGAMQDISSITETDNLKPGRSWTAQILGAVPGLFDERAGAAVKRAVDRMGDVLHAKLLWDRVQDLQFGLFETLSDYARQKGLSPETADRMAAHMANRYAGTLPVEAMSPLARKLSNVLLFSRTYTLGNLGVLKDAVGGMFGSGANLFGRAVGRSDIGKNWGGLPTDVQAQIARDAPEELGKVQSLAKRKTLGILAVDVALIYAVNSIAQSLFAYSSGREKEDEIWNGYFDRLKALEALAQRDPLAVLNPIDDLDVLSATSENELDPATGKPLRRIFVGYDKEGTAIYARNPLGKFGEEYTNWLTAPLSTLKSKLNALAVRPTLDVLANDKGFGRKIYLPTDSAAEAMAKIAAHYVEATLPMDQINAARDMLMGKTKELDAARMVGRAAGVTFRRGAPGGPAVGLYYQVRSAHEAQVNEQLPEIRQKIIDGKLEDARRQMTTLGIPWQLQRYYIRTARNPNLRLSPHAMREFSRYATPQERAQMDRLRGGSQ